MGSDSPDKSPLPTPNDGKTIESQKFRIGADGNTEDVSEPKQEQAEPGINPLGVPKFTLECHPDDPMFEAAVRATDEETRAGHAAQRSNQRRPWQQTICDLQKRLTRKQWFNTRSNSPTQQQRKASKDKDDDDRGR
jgi:hypothetical protein